MARKAPKKSETPPEVAGDTGDGSVEVEIIEAFTHQRRLIVRTRVQGELMTFNLPQAQFEERTALLKEIKYRYLELKRNVQVSKKSPIEAFKGVEKV